MAHPFQVGDVVYHVRFGEGVVRQKEGHPDNVYVEFKRGGVVDSHTKYLSFKPWPAPCHERPVEDGWWIVTQKATPKKYDVREFKEGGFYFADGSPTDFSRENYSLIRYLGKTIEGP